MSKNLIFMAGLPRSGSTLLGTLLAQNPRIYSEPASPLMEIIMAINKTLERNEHYKAYPKPSSLYSLVAGLFDSYYAHTDKPIIIDKNRGWPTQIPGLEQCVVDRAKIICPVRNIDQIVASFLKLAKNNSFDASTGRVNFIDRYLISHNKPLNDVSRCEYILSSSSILGASITAIQHAMKSDFRDRLHLVEYGDLMAKPIETLRGIYEFIGEEPYEDHDFSNIIQTNTELDAEIFGIPDMHVIRKELSASDTNSKEILPEHIYKQCKGTEFWRAESAAIAK